MLGNMRGEVTRKCKAPATDSTRQAAAAVSHQVSLQVGHLQEAVVTVRAPMRPPAFVDEEVRVQVCLLLECFVAHLALEPLHARVAEQVSLQVVLLREQLAADLALPRPAVPLRRHDGNHHRRRIFLQLAVGIVTVARRYHRCASRVRTRVRVCRELAAALCDAKRFQLGVAAAASVSVDRSRVRRSACRDDGSAAVTPVATRHCSIRPGVFWFHDTVRTTVEISHHHSGGRS